MGRVSPLPYSLARSRFRDDARAAIDAALDAVNPALAVRRTVTVDGDRLTVDKTTYDLTSIEKIGLVSVGKAAVPMGGAVASMLADRIDEGIIVAHAIDHPEAFNTRTMHCVVAGHPVPTDHGVDASKQVLTLARRLSGNDLLITLISGGTSSLLTYPAEGITLAAIRRTTSLLLGAGADIEAVNTVRKHLSAIKGGLLAKHASPARTVSLILSDVIGDAIDAIGSGPTAPDPTTFADAVSVLEACALIDRVPRSVREHLLAGRDGHIPETLKPGDGVFDRVQHVTVGSNTHAVEGAAQCLAERGFDVRVHPSPVTGEAREAGQRIADMVLETVESARTDRPIGLIWGGETTVTVQGSGLGGRNQELALAAVPGLAPLDGHRDVVLISLATDGRDGPTDAAGAVISPHSLARADAMRLAPARSMDNNDSHRFFAALDDLLFTGPTHTNVADVVLALIS